MRTTVASQLVAAHRIAASILSIAHESEIRVYSSQVASQAIGPLVQVELADEGQLRPFADLVGGSPRLHVDRAIEHGVKSWIGVLAFSTRDWPPSYYSYNFLVPVRVYVGRHDSLLQRAVEGPVRPWIS